MVVDFRYMKGIQVVGSGGNAIILRRGALISLDKCAEHIFTDDFIVVALFAVENAALYY